MADAEERIGRVNKRQRYKPDCDHVLRKRLPPRLPRRSNDIYITNKSNYQVCICNFSSGTWDLVVLTDKFCRIIRFIDRVSSLDVRNC